MTNKPPICIIIADSHRIFRIGLRTELGMMNIDAEVVGEAASANELLALMAVAHPPLIVLLGIDSVNITMKIDVIRFIHEKYPGTNFIAMLSDAHDNTIRQLLDAGVYSFLDKNVPLNELQTAIEYVASGGSYCSDQFATTVNGTQQNFADANKAAFTPRELEIIKLCAEGLSAKQIAARLYVSLKTVIAHKYNIFRKMGISNCVEMIRYALRKGIIRL